MANRKDGAGITDERVEDTTMYGEFIASYDQWMTPDRQRENARRLEKVTEAPARDLQKKQTGKKASNQPK